MPTLHLVLDGNVSERAPRVGCSNSVRHAASSYSRMRTPSRPRRRTRVRDSSEPDGDGDSCVGPREAENSVGAVGVGVIDVDLKYVFEMAATTELTESASPGPFGREEDADFGGDRRYPPASCGSVASTQGRETAERIRPLPPSDSHPTESSRRLNS